MYFYFLNHSVVRSASTPPCRLQTSCRAGDAGDCMRGKKTARSGSAAATKTKLSGGGKVYDPDAPLTAKDYWQMGTTLLIALLLGRYVLYPLLVWYRDSRSSHLGTGSCAS